MTTLLRLPQELAEAVHRDLDRPHAFAAERVGFLFGRSEEVGPGDWVTCATSYLPVSDGDYIRTRVVGALINAEAIRRALQKVLDTNESAFHVHRHDHLGFPRFSGVDRRTISSISASSSALSPGSVHGGLLLSLDSSTTLVRVPSSLRLSQGEVSTVGHPTKVRNGAGKV